MQLVSMGFNMEGCKKAVYHTHNQGVEPAMNWVLEHMGDPGMCQWWAGFLVCASGWGSWYVPVGGDPGMCQWAGFLVCASGQGLGTRGGVGLHGGSQRRVRMHTSSDVICNPYGKLLY